MPRPVAMLCLIAAMALTGANVPLAKGIVAQIPAEPLLLIRFALAAALLAALAPFEPGPRLSSLGARQWGAVLVLGLLGSVLFTWLVLEGVKRTSGANAGIILAALPAVVALIGLARGERPRRGVLAMIAMAVAGVGLIQGQAMSGANGGVRETLTGNLLIGLAVACEATFVIVARGISTRLRPIRLSLGVALVSLACCLPFVLPGLAGFEPARVDATTWALLVWYTLTASMLCTALWYRGVAHVAAWAAGLATAAVPVAALAVSVLWLGERIAPPQIVGAALVVAAIAVGTLAQRTRREPAGPRMC